MLLNRPPRSAADCPDEVEVGYDRNLLEDTSFSITCNDAAAGVEYYETDEETEEEEEDEPEFLDPLGLMDRATKAVMDYDEAVAAMNGGRNGEKTDAAADEKQAAPATTTEPSSKGRPPSFAADSGYSGVAVWGPGGSLMYSLSLSVCALLRRFSD